MSFSFTYRFSISKIMIGVSFSKYPKCSIFLNVQNFSKTIHYNLEQIPNELRVSVNVRIVSTNLSPYRLRVVT